MARVTKPAAAWMLAVIAAAAIGLNGCGGSSSGSPSAGVGHRLNRQQERKLLTLVASAKLDAAAKDTSGARATLAKLISEVRSLRVARAISTSAAVGLAARARAAERDLPRPLADTSAPTAREDQTQTTAAPTPAATPSPTGPPSQSNPAPPAPARGAQQSSQPGQDGTLGHYGHGWWHHHQGWQQQSGWTGGGNS